MIYLDNAATTFQKPNHVYRATMTAMQKYGANAGRGGYKLSIKAADLIYDCAEKISELFKIPDPTHIAFTLNTTAALNMAIKGVATRSGHIITTSMEHNSVLRPVMSIAKHRHSIVWGDKYGYIDPEDIVSAIRPDTKLIIINHASNVCGSVQDIKRVGEIAKDRNILFLVDAAQSAGSIDIDVDKMGIDMLAFPGHKGLLGPQGTGGLYIRQGLEIDTIIEGGTGSESDKPYQPAFMPDRLHAGTINTPAIAGLCEGVKFVLKTSVSEIHKHEISLTKQLLEGLYSIDNVVVFGNRGLENRVGVVSIKVKDKDPVEVCVSLDSEFDIAVRCGLHCAPLAHQTIKSLPEGTIRISPGVFNTPKDIDKFLYAINSIAKS